MFVIARLRKPAEIPPGHTLQVVSRVRLLPRLWEELLRPRTPMCPRGCSGQPKIGEVLTWASEEAAGS